VVPAVNTGFFKRQNGHKMVATLNPYAHLEVIPMARSTTSTKSQTSGTACFAGLDYHKKFTQVSIGDEYGRELLSMRIPNDQEAFRRFFAELPRVRCAIESCRGYEWLLEFLREELNLEVELVNAKQLKLIAQSRCKTDKIDARLIMQMLAIGFLPTCYQPTGEERRLRERLRWRAHLVRYTTRMKVRIYALLDKENASRFIDDPMSKTGRCLLKQVQLKPGRQELLEEHIELLQHFERLVKAEGAWVSRELAKNTDARLLMSIPGIGELTALLLWCELGDITRFRDAPQVAAYFGLVPSVDSSAARFRYGPITKEGSQFVRWMVIQCAWQAIRTSMELRNHFNSVTKRASKNGAIVSVARKLVKIAYRVLRDKKPFRADLVGKQKSA
jgi:transposase